MYWCIIRIHVLWNVSPLRGRKHYKTLSLKRFHMAFSFRTGICKSLSQTLYHSYLRIYHCKPKCPPKKQKPTKLSRFDSVRQILLKQLKRFPFMPRALGRATFLSIAGLRFRTILDRLLKDSILHAHDRVHLWNTWSGKNRSVMLKRN